MYVFLNSEKINFDIIHFPELEKINLFNFLIYQVSNTFPDLYIFNFENLII